MNELETLLLETGTVQFGRFGPDNRPYHENLSLLPSYPELMHELSEVAAQEIESIGQIDRLVSTIDSLPIATAISLATHIPLVYSLGTDQPGVRDLVGAYDVGHPACLILNQLGNTSNSDAHRLVEKASHVGLDIQHVLVLLDAGFSNPGNQIAVHALVKLHDYVETLRAHGLLPEGQVDAVKAWLNHAKQVRSAP